MKRGWWKIAVSVNSVRYEYGMVHKNRLKCRHIMIMIKRFCVKKQTTKYNDVRKSLIVHWISDVMPDDHDLYVFPSKLIVNGEQSVHAQL